jgi:cytochrome c oxidase subunit III
MAQPTTHDPDVYYVPHHSKWPIIGSITLFMAMLGLASWLNEASWGMPLFLVGLAGVAATLFGWFGDVIRESLAGNYNRKVDISFRLGMMWFILSEVMFFAVFFGALYYARSLRPAVARRRRH